MVPFSVDLSCHRHATAIFMVESRFKGRRSQGQLRWSWRIPSDLQGEGCDALAHCTVLLEKLTGLSRKIWLHAINHQDNSTVVIKQEEHSAIHHYITYSAVSAEPALTYSSVYSTIRVYPVTSGPLENSTFVEWSATFSGDADVGVIQVRSTQAEHMSMRILPGWQASRCRRTPDTSARKDWRI